MQDTEHGCGEKGKRGDGEGGGKKMEKGRGGNESNPICFLLHCYSQHFFLGSVIVDHLTHFLKLLFGPSGVWKPLKSSQIFKSLYQALLLVFRHRMFAIHSCEARSLCIFVCVYKRLDILCLYLQWASSFCKQPCERFSDCLNVWSESHKETFWFRTNVPFVLFFLTHFFPHNPFHTHRN